MTLIVFDLPPPMSLFNARRLSVCLSVCLSAVSRIEITDRIFMKILRGDVSFDKKDIPLNF